MDFNLTSISFGMITNDLPFQVFSWKDFNLSDFQNKTSIAFDSLNLTNQLSRFCEQFQELYWYNHTSITFDSPNLMYQVYLSRLQELSSNPITNSLLMEYNICKNRILESAEGNTHYIVLVAFILLILCITTTYSHDIWRLIVKLTKLHDQSTSTFFAYKETRLNTWIVEKIQSNVGDYIAPWWYNSHLGSIIPFGHNPNLEYTRQLFDLDHTVFPVDWYPIKPDLHEKKLRICILFPGLKLTSKDKFAQKFVQILSNAGYYCAVVNARGCSLPLKSCKFWFPGCTDDANHFLDYIYETYPTAELYLVGFSAGSNIIHKLITCYPNKQLIKAGFTVCINGDYLKSRKHIESTIQGKIYSFLITLCQKDIIHKNSHVHQHINANHLSKLFACNFASEFDIIWSTILGFPNEEKYYETLSSNFADRRLTIPYLALQPRDDPLHQSKPRDNVQIENFYQNPHVIYIEPFHGNHFGFYEGSLFELFTNTTSYTYPARVAIEFFQALADWETQKFKMR